MFDRDKVFLMRQFDVLGGDIILLIDPRAFCACDMPKWGQRSEEHTSELQSHSETSYAVFCLKKKKRHHQIGVNVRPVEVKPMSYTLLVYGVIVPEQTIIYRINAFFFFF